MIIPDAPWSADDTGWATQICDRLGERRSRLFVSACCRGYCKEPVPAEVAEALETYDRYADTGKTKAALRESKDRIAPHTKHTKFAYLIGNMFNTDVMPRSYRRQFGDVYNVLEAALSADFDVRLLPRLGLGAECNLKLNRVDAIAHLERVLVEIGYPEPPIGQLDPRWRTADVLGLARAVYADRAFDRMPFLADALLDAGCDAQAIIDHCRTAGAHQRGCWVLDLILAGQWKEIWEKPKSDGGKSKASRSPFGLTDANKRHLKRSMAVEARDGMEDRLTWVYEYQLPGRAERARDAHARNELKNRSVEQYLEREAYVCAFGREYWLDRGRVRRIASNDPGELARHASLACRATWIHDYTEYGWTPPEIIAESLLHAIAVRDTLVEQRFLADRPPRRSRPAAGAILYEAVCSSARGDWDAIRALPPINPAEDPDGAAGRSIACLAAVSQNSADLFAARLREHLQLYRPQGLNRSYWSAALIDLEAHGLYELARRKSPDLVAAFDVNHTPPWDAGLHQWVQSHSDLLGEVDWVKVPLEIRAGLRDLPRPGWWGAQPS